MAESQLIDEIDETTSEIGVSPASVESEQLQLSHSPGNSDEMLKELLFRQKGLDTLLNRFLEEQTQINLNNNTQIEDLKQCITTLQTVEGNRNPAGRTGALASDRGATDATPGYTWPTSSNPGDMSSRQDLVTSLAAPPKPTADYRATEVLPVGFDPVYSERTVFSGFPQPRAQSVEGATHVSIGTRSGVNNKEYQVNNKEYQVNNKEYQVHNNTSRVFDHESKV